MRGSEMSSTTNIGPIGEAASLSRHLSAVPAVSNPQTLGAGGDAVKDFDARRAFRDKKRLSRIATLVAPRAGG